MNNATGHGYEGLIGELVRKTHKKLSEKKLPKYLPAIERGTPFLSFSFSFPSSSNPFLGVSGLRSHMLSHFPSVIPVLDFQTFRGIIAKFGISEGGEGGGEGGGEKGKGVKNIAEILEERGGILYRRGIEAETQPSIECM